MPRENQDDVGRLAKRFITAGTPIAADESEVYNLLHAHFPLSRVNHSQAYCAEDRTNTHQAESCHARFQRMVIGQHHHFGLGYLANYANEIAYREDTRRWSDGEIFRDILTKCARTPTHRDWCGDWLGNTGRPERLVPPEGDSVSPPGAGAVLQRDGPGDTLPGEMAQHGQQRLAHPRHGIGLSR